MCENARKGAGNLPNELDHETPHNSKEVMLRAENSDTIEIHGRGEFIVARRSETYHGPKLWLKPVDDGEPVKLTAPGLHHDLQLWELKEDDTGFAQWQPTEQVTAELVDFKQYDVCLCGEPLKNSEHRSWAFFGVGEHGR